MPNINNWFPVLAFVIGCIVTLFIGVLEIYILIFIWEGTWNVHHKRNRGINLANLISESSGDASLARFQLLIFVFVISMSLVLIITSGQPPAFPKSIPDQILGLLGISSTSYVLGKALQTQVIPRPPDPPIPPCPPPSDPSNLSSPPPPDPSNSSSPPPSDPSNSSDSSPSDPSNTSPQ